MLTKKFFQNTSFQNERKTVYNYKNLVKNQTTTQYNATVRLIDLYKLQKQILSEIVKIEDNLRLFIV